MLKSRKKEIFILKSRKITKKNVYKKKKMLYTKFNGRCLYGIIGKTK